MTSPKMPSAETLERWLDRQRERDPNLYRALEGKRRQLAETPELAVEGVARDTGATVDGLLSPDIVIETIVRDGRPALFIERGTFTTDGSLLDPISAEIIARLDAARDKVDAVIPLVGRIDVVNHPTGVDFLGTGWLVADDILVTNRHVAELLATRGLERYEFITGRFGDPIAANAGYGHERGGGDGPVSKIEEVLYIEPPGTGPDIALLRIARRTDGTTKPFIELATNNPRPGDDVVVIGYPARAPASTIPDQQRMDRLYGGIYDVKRAAPGKIDDESRGWTTHDCTTLGGNSGSVVLDLTTGRACALHFAGLYLVENYAVPASTIANLRDNRPAYRLQRQEQAGWAQPCSQPSPASFQSIAGSLPLTITVTIGVGAVGASQLSTGDPAVAAAGLVVAAGREGVLAVRPGLVVKDDALVDRPCLVVAAAPGRVAEVEARLPPVYSGLPVQVRPAALEDQLGFTSDLVEAPRAIAYDDDARNGPEFSLSWIREPMKLRLHVGPDRGFSELRPFLEDAQSELVSAIYQFYAEPIRSALAVSLSRQTVRMTLVADPQTRDQKNAPPDGQFSRADTFAAWAATGRFQNVYVPEGNGGLVDNAYHIKVTVKDNRHFWLSSGNWTRTSQPVIPEDQKEDPTRVSGTGNREWHVIGDSPALACRLRSHILQDFATSGHLGGLPESLSTTILVDVPELMFEAIQLEAAPDRVFEPLDVQGELRVRLLLTPDRMGGIYCDAVLDLIASAQDQLLFQNQYIKVTPGSAGRFGALCDALAKAAARLRDCRIILRSDGTGFWDNVAELRRRGVDISRQVRRLANTHTKGIVVDGRQVLVGSHNWSQSGVTTNRDASLIIDDARAANYFASVFETDWARSSRLTEPRRSVPEAARLATGIAPPSGFRRVSLAEYLEG